MPLTKRQETHDKRNQSRNGNIVQDLSKETEQKKVEDDIRLSALLQCGMKECTEYQVGF